MQSPDTKNGSPSAIGLKLRVLNLEQVRRIDELLASIGDYGELHLVVQHGELRYMNRVESHKAWKNDGDTGETR